jgi:hypothetical protein
VESSSPRSEGAQDALEVYQLGFEADDYAGLAADRADERDRVGRLDGSPRAEGWQPPRLHWDLVGGLPIPEFCDWNSMPIFSNRAAQALGDLLDGRGEWLELDISGGPRDYRGFNITRLSDVLDEDASDIEYAVDEPGKIMWVRRWAVHADLLAQETIFKLARDPAAERFVTDVVRDRIEQVGLTGFWWRSRLFPPTGPPPVPDLDFDPASRIYTQLVPDPEELGDPEEIVTHRIIPAFEADNADLYEAQARANQFGIGPDDGINGCFLTRRAHTEAYTESYFKELHQRLAQARSTKEAQAALTTIGDQLEAGTFPPSPSGAP